MNYEIHDFNQELIKLSERFERRRSLLDSHGYKSSDSAFLGNLGHEDWKLLSPEAREEILRLLESDLKGSLRSIQAEMTETLGKLSERLEEL